MPELRGKVAADAGDGLHASASSAIWHTWRTQHWSHIGLRAVHTARPCSTSRWQKSDDSSGGRILRSAVSILTGSFSPSTRPIRFESRMPVRVHDHGGLVVHVAKNEIGRFAPTPGQGSEGPHRVWHAAAVFRDELARTQDDVPCLRPVKAAGMDIGLYVLRFGGGKRLERREACIQHRRDLVDTLICALRGQPHGKQQFIIFLILQGAVRRVGLMPDSGGSSCTCSGVRILFTSPAV